jgi:hypothetical protein
MVPVKVKMAVLHDALLQKAFNSNLGWRMANSGPAQLMQILPGLIDDFPWLD